MKRLLDFILESRENEMYRDFPEPVRKPFHHTLSRRWYSEEEIAKQKQARKEQDAPYKEYKKNCIQINTDNFEILLDKLLDAMKSRQGKNNFILSAQTCTFSNYYFNKNDTHDFFDDVEKAVLNAHMALQSNDMSFTRFKQTRNKSNILYGTAFTQSIYDTMCIIAQAYNVNIPKFNKEFDFLSIESEDERYYSIRGYSNNSETASKRAAKEYSKDAQKLVKAREKFKKTPLYGKIIDILNKVESDLKAVEPNFKKWDEQLEQMALEDESIEKTKDLIQKAIEDAFGKEPRLAYSPSSLQSLVSKAYMTTNEMPEIKIVDKYHAGWLAGLYSEITFEVFDSDGNSYGKTKLRDRGIRGDNGEVVDGFGPWD